MRQGDIFGLTAGYEARTIQVELPCINGLRAWFTVASVQPSIEEQEWTEGALSFSESNDRATLIAEYRTAAPDLARAYLAEREATAAVYRDLLSAISKEPPSMYGSSERNYIMDIIVAHARARQAGKEKKDA